VVPELGPAPLARAALPLAFAVSLAAGCARSAPQPDVPAGYTLVWSDEFEHPGLPDSTRWAYDVGDGCPGLCGWGNEELQFYTDRRRENARVEDGHLVIEARKEPAGARAYTSARLVTRGRADWTYGRFEIRARLPSGRGTWPALWMLPTGNAYGGWPASGEIDIMEHVGFAPDSVHGSVHTAAYNHIRRTQSTARIAVPDAERAFHVYAVEWTPARIDFFVDGTRYHSFANEHTGPEAWPFDRPFHLILNVAVGGMWGGMRGVDETIWPQRLVVDYVRVLQRR